MSRFARKNIKRLQPYVPGDQPPAGSNVIKLNTNENPYPPSPAVTRVMRTLPVASLRQYPQPQADEFRRSSASVLGVKPEMIIAGNGSDELLNLIIRTFVDVGQAIAYPVPTYSLYPVLAKMQDAKVIEIPFGTDFALPDRLLEVDASVIFVCNPNAPTGTFVEPSQIERLATATSAVVVVDEAYVDFADDNCLKLVKNNDNVIVLRTLSKGYGLAGLRFGFAVAGDQLIADMLKVKDSYNCDTLSIAIAAAAVRDRRYLEKTVTGIRQQRSWLVSKLRGLGFTVLPSQSNFVWAQIDHPPAKRIYLQLKRRGILVRYFDQPQLKRGLRITVGLARQNRALVDALAEIINRSAHNKAR